MKIYPRPRVRGSALLLAVALCSAAFGQSSAADPPASTEPPVENPFIEADLNRVVATIGGEKMTAADFEAIVDGLDQQSQAQVRGPLKREFIEHVVIVKMLARQAAVMHMDQLPATKTALDYEKDKVLAAAVYKAMVANARVDSETLNKYYEEHKQDYLQVWVHHIVVPFKGYPSPLKEGQKELTEEEALAKAQDLVKRLKGGEDFATLAAAESADSVSAAKGGDLGVPILRGQTPKPFEDAAFGLSAGQISDPIKGQFGYEIIRADKFEAKPVEQVRKELAVKLKPLAAKNQADALKEDLSVTLDESFFGPPPAASPAAPTHKPQPSAK